MTVLEAVILILGGGAAGFINTLAGGGSAITIPILNEMVGISTANGTNRIAILAANLSAVAGFQKGKAIPWSRVAPLLPPTVVGAALGAWVASQTDPDLLRQVFAVVLLLVASHGAPWHSWPSGSTAASFKLESGFCCWRGWCWAAG